MDWFTEDEREELVDNARRTLAGEDFDPVPPVMLFNPMGRQRWLVTEINPDDPSRGYGLADLGIGAPECGDIDFSEISGSAGTAHIPAERSLTYKPQPGMTLATLDRIASAAGRIVF